MTTDCSKTEGLPVSELGPALAELIGKASGMSPAQIGVDSRLQELGFDSLRQFQLMLELEKLAGREFTDEELETILVSATVGDLHQALLSFLGAARPPA